MLISDTEKLYPSAKILVRDKVASRLHAKDESLYDFDEAAAECAKNFTGWTTLASQPPYSYKKIQAFAESIIAEGFKTVLLIGQGGSTQAPMTITKYNKVDRNALDFKVLDSVSPVRVRSILAGLDLERTLVLVSSKSGGTIEMRSVLDAVLDHFEMYLKTEKIPSHLVAITDPGSDLEKRAHDEGWRACFLGEPTVGGRFSALSVFGLVPAALVGIDLGGFLGHAKDAERVCSEDSIDNPAITLASFLYDNYLNGRDKFSFLTPKRGRVLGLWIEQLVAESLGKQGVGILPNIELDALLLTEDPKDRSVITYQTKTDLWDERKNFDMSLAYLDSAIPRLSFRIDSVLDLAEHFVMWEYATAMCGYLMKRCPFDQPDVASTKAAALKFLAEGCPKPDFTENFIGNVNMGKAEVTIAPCIKSDTLMGALRNLFASIKPGDYFALDAFLPFDGEGRREALEVIRHGVADKLGVVSCLEIGPRYLHSTGQLQKGGTNNGVFLMVSADELKDIPLRHVEPESLGMLARTQAAADLSILIERGRRCMHLHLPDNSGVTIRALGDAVMKVLDEIERERAAE
ncbi:glucose-6-phosphate isomerase [Slackia isoflavoniconvertens]|uniref:glucose-6-phosphate isomerase n=1 Tax=Slackia isoflavoniconvertens TaxID=572010 RepID=UPI0030795907